MVKVSCSRVVLAPRPIKDDYMIRILKPTKVEDNYVEYRTKEETNMTDIDNEDDWSNTISQRNKTTEEVEKKTFMLKCKE